MIPDLRTMTVNPAAVQPHRPAAARIAEGRAATRSVRGQKKSQAGEARD
jgi:hypothetical protein